MTVAIFETSPYISERLVDLIAEKNEGVVFKKYSNRSEAVEYLRNPLPGAILMDVRFVGSYFEQVFDQYKSNTDTRLIVMHQVMDELTREKYLAIGTDHLVDLYHDFEKIPALIREISLTRNL
jgi:DNA-binding NarL/FixJ family response regulator